MRTLLGLGLLLAAMLGAQGIHAQDAYPNRAITLVVPVPPGGASDFIARTVGQKLSDAVGQPVVINNQGGASGTIASGNVAKAAPDGYTLLMSSITTHGIGPLINTNAPYDTLKDFTSVIFLSDLPLIMTLHAGHPMKSVAEVIAYGKANQGKLSFASSGNGGAPHLSGELFKIVIGVDMLHVPYRGSGPAVTDLLGGRIELMFAPAPVVVGHIPAGTLRAIGTTGVERSPLFPGMPTVAETGLPGFNSIAWFGVFAPASMPADLAARISADVGRALTRDDVKRRLADEGAEPAPNSPEVFTAFINADVKVWNELADSAGIALGK